MRLKYRRTQVFDDYSAVMHNLNVNRDLERKENSDYSGVSDKCLLRKYLRNRAIFCTPRTCVRPLRPPWGDSIAQGLAPSLELSVAFRRTNETEPTPLPESVGAIARHIALSSRSH